MFKNVENFQDIKKYIRNVTSLSLKAVSYQNCWYKMKLQYPFSEREKYIYGSYNELFEEVI